MVFTVNQQTATIKLAGVLRCNVRRAKRLLCTMTSRLLRLLCRRRVKRGACDAIIREILMQRSLIGAGSVRHPSASLV